MITGSAAIAKVLASGLVCARAEQEFGALGGIAEQVGDAVGQALDRRRGPSCVHSTSKAITACSAKAAPTTRSRIALRLVDNRNARARIARIPAMLSRF